MANRGDPEGLRITRSNHRERLSCERARLDEMSAAFDRMNTYFQDSTMIINVRRMHMPVMTIASLRRILLSDAEEGELWQEIGPLMSKSGILHARPRRGSQRGVSAFLGASGMIRMETFPVIHSDHGPNAVMGTTQTPSARL